MTQPELFQVGGNLTHDELRISFQRIFGRPLPLGADARRIAGRLSAELPVRFTHEVNRCRGWAFDVEDLRTGG